MADQPDGSVSSHYTHGGLLHAIEAALTKIGKTPEAVTVDDLAPVDEFHIGGREASVAFLDQLGCAADSHILDVGCGLGGASRFAADRYGTQVTGIDLTAEFVETGRHLCAWVGLASQVTLQEASALNMPFAATSFDRAYMMHVGMNIADKDALFREVGRVLKPGSVFGVYDIMRIADGALTYPVPWAATGDTSALAAPDTYETALTQAGFTIESRRDRRDFALDFFAKVQARVAEHGPPPLGLHVLIGEEAPVRIGNMVAALKAGLIAPVELIARKPA